MQCTIISPALPKPYNLRHRWVRRCDFPMQDFNTGYIIQRFTLIIALILSLIFVASAAPTYAPTEGKNPLKVYFTFPGGEECDSVRWTFGDDNSSTAITTDHTYYSLGMYYPTCYCELPGANVSYTYDYVYVIPWSSSIRDSLTGGRPKQTVVNRTSVGLDPDSLKKQAEGLAAIGEMRYAADAYADLKSLGTLDSETLTTYGDVLTGLGRLSEAETAYNEALAGNESAPVLKKLADVLFSLGKTKEAIDTMNRTLALTPDDAGAYASYASFLQKAGKTAEALDAYNQSFKLLDAQPGLWSEYADLLTSLGRLTEAADAYDHATSLGMVGSEIWNNYSRVLQKLGRKEEAQRAKEQAMNTYAPIASSMFGSSDGIPTCGIGSLC